MLFKRTRKEFNVLVTIDVEEYFHVFFGDVSNFPETWDALEPDFLKMVPALYEIIKLTDGKCVLFVVGWLAEKYPEIILGLSKTGVEIASHGYLHRPVERMTLDELSKDLVKSKSVIESAIGKTVRAFRAPGFSIQPGHHEALSKVFDAGFSVDSSIVGGSDLRNKLTSRGVEVPEPGFKFGSRCIPTGGGAVFRILPLCLFKLLHRKSKSRKEPLNFYIHSWELYPSRQVHMSRFSAFLQYYNTHKAMKKTQVFLSQCNFITLDEYIDLINIS